MAAELAEAAVHCVQDASDLARDTFMRLLRQYSHELQEPRAFLPLCWREE